MQEYTATHLVKGEDLNHHGTLFAARGTAWLVEAAFVAAACAQGDTSQVVCRNLHDMYFSHPMKKGGVLTLKSRIVHAGRTSLMVYVEGRNELTEEPIMEGFLTFVTIQEGGGKIAHGIVLDEPEDEKERELRQRAFALLQ